MKNEEELHSFAVASLTASTIILTGGKIGSTYQKKCLALDVLHDRWYSQELPDLVQARRNHGNCCIGNYVYVIAGFGDGDWLKTIE